jgi:hypothetical protein
MREASKVGEVHMEDVTKARFVEVADNLLKVHFDADGKVLDKKICKTAIINALGDAYEHGLQDG